MPFEMKSKSFSLVGSLGAGAFLLSPKNALRKSSLFGLEVLFEVAVFNSEFTSLLVTSSVRSFFLKLKFLPFLLIL